jgi:hypothetical protein
MEVAARLGVRASEVVKMKTSVLAICHIKKGNAFLFRKKPDGSPPYKETWYGFGVPLDGDNREPELALSAAVKQQTGIEIKVTERLWWDVETKPDHDGEQAFFVYLHTVAEYVSGDLSPGVGIEKLEWVDVADLAKYAIVPPSKAFLGRYLK